MQHVAYHFKVTVKREITLLRPHALVTLYKNFVQSEVEVLQAKRFVGEKIAHQHHVLSPCTRSERCT